MSWSLETAMGRPGRLRPLFALGLATLLLHCSGPSPASAADEAQSGAVATGEEEVTSHAENGDHGIDHLPSSAEIAALPPDGGPGYNRLIFEHSPYLLQHADNPVDWYPWGEEAFEAARREDKPIFLSVGYSTCHWCHVMEHESFEDDEVAALMNEHFIPVKVDREERPDVDHVYMQVTQAMTGGGGWPMTVVMTPEREPFFAGTYFPREGRFGRPGMLDLLPEIANVWTNRRQDALQSARAISQAIQQTEAAVPGAALGEEALALAERQLASRFDEVHGGIGSAPKFPTPHNLLFLLRRWHRTQNPETLNMVTTTLRAMRLGGIFDHVGFGFHRYSTDAQWLLPHFEKMLYDQALLAMAYTEAFQATGDEQFAQTAREIFTYVLRDMTSPEGGFYSAEDADSEGEEGTFYLWSTDEVRQILGEEDGALFTRVFNLEPGGNFREESTGQRTGTNIPHLTQPLAEIAREMDMEEDALRERLESIRQRLFEVRERRIHPLRDDKILTDWNGLMIAALARAGRALNEPEYTEAARRAADFALTHLRDAETGRLHKRIRLGQAGLPAHLEDYAFLVLGLTDLYEATFEVRWLEEALALNQTMIELFADEENGGFFMTAEGGEELLMRPKEIYDGAIPSGNSVAAMNLLRLGRITADSDLERRADGLMRAFSTDLSHVPAASCFLMTALDFAVGPSHEIVIAGEPGAEDTQALLDALWAEYFPSTVVLLRPETEDPAIASLAPYTANQSAIDGQAAAYVCQNFSCRAPTTDPAQMVQNIVRGLRQ